MRLTRGPVLDVNVYNRSLLYSMPMIPVCLRALQKGGSLESLR